MRVYGVRRPFADQYDRDTLFLTATDAAKAVLKAFEWTVARNPHPRDGGATERMKAILDDPDGFIAFINHAMEDRFGYQVELWTITPYDVLTADEWEVE